MSAAKERKKVTVNQKRPVACDGFEGECEGRSHDDNKNQAKKRQKKRQKKENSICVGSQSFSVVEKIHVPRLLGQVPSHPSFFVSLSLSSHFNLFLLCYGSTYSCVAFSLFVLFRFGLFRSPPTFSIIRTSLYKTTKNQQTQKEGKKQRKGKRLNTCSLVLSRPRWSPRRRLPRPLRQTRRARSPSSPWRSSTLSSFLRGNGRQGSAASAATMSRVPASCVRAMPK
jgi:hypothetical protein